MSDSNGLYTVVYSPAAQNDVRSIYMYIAYELLAEETAIDQVKRIRTAIHSLDALPERFGAVDWEPWASMGMRKMPVDNYIVFYLVDTQSRIVTVDRVFYTGQDIQRIIQRTTDQR